MSNVCTACAHPGRDVIDEFCRNGRYVFENGDVINTAKELIAAMKERYPDAKVLKESNLSLHKKRHTGGIKYIIEANDTLKKPNGDVIKHISPIESMKIIVTLGTLNLMENPEKISAAHVVDAVGNLARIGGAIKDENEAKKAWAAKLKGLANRKVKNTDGNVTEVDFSKAANG
jgi:hypothetical protein